MLFRPVVIDTIESTLENSPNAFNSIWVRHAIYKFLGRMPHTLMFILITKIYITSVSSVYRVESGLMFSLTAFFQSVAFTILYRHGFHPSASFPHADNGCLALCAAARVLLFAMIPVFFPNRPNKSHQTSTSSFKASMFQSNGHASSPMV